jgi:hypothetical protein
LHDFGISVSDVDEMDSATGNGGDCSVTVGVFVLPAHPRYAIARHIEISIVILFILHPSSLIL